MFENANNQIMIRFNDLSDRSSSIYCVLRVENLNKRTEVKTN